MFFLNRDSLRYSYLFSRSFCLYIYYQILYFKKRSTFQQMIFHLKVFIIQSLLFIIIQTSVNVMFYSEQQPNGTGCIDKVVINSTKIITNPSQVENEYIILLILRVQTACMLTYLLAILYYVQAL